MTESVLVRGSSTARVVAETSAPYSAPPSSPREQFAKVSKRGSETRQRSISVHVRLTPEESAKLEANAERAGLTVASFARFQMIGGPVPRAARKPPIERELAGKLLGQMGKIGSNLNQVARSVNRDTWGPIDQEEAQRLLVELRGVLLQALGRKP